MNKKLMAVAVAGALGAPGLAVAQVGSSPGITLYGRLDSAIMSNKFSETVTAPTGNPAPAAPGIPNFVPSATISELKKGDVFSPGNAMGVRGREDLGGGTAAWFQLETGVWPDGRLENSATNGAHFGGRNSGLGISSAWGDIMYGIWDQPYKLAYGTANVITSGPFSAAGIILGNGDTTGALPNSWCTSAVSNTTGSTPFIPTPATTIVRGGIAYQQNACVTEVTGNSTAFSRRINNTIQYWSPVVNGAQFRLATAVANYQSPGSADFTNGLPKPKLWSGSVTWSRGPLAVAAGYETHQGFRPDTSTTVGRNVDAKDTGFQLGAKWDFGPGQVGAGYEKLSYGDNCVVNGARAASSKMDVPAFVVNGKYNLGPGAIWAGYSKTSGGKNCTNPTFAGYITVVGSAACGSDGQAKMMALGYDYILSKRTKMYVAYNKIDNGAGTSYYYIAGPAGNNGGGSIGGTAVTGQAAAFNGTAGGVAQGTDVTSLAFGIQHTF